VRGTPGTPTLDHVDWPRTFAYGLGFNGVYLNLAGRERTGIVPPAGAEALLARLERDLSTWRDPGTGRPVVTALHRPSRDFPGSGTGLHHAPDLVVGYARGWRNGGASAVGEIPAEIVAPNTARWSGDHCIDARWVPGVLFTSFSTAEPAPTLYDVAPTVLSFFGVTPPRAWPGRTLSNESPLRRAPAVH
jgi:predicted AlkP superfamily phosphohydrolase/phosphomutase